MNLQRLNKDIRDLSYVYILSVDDGYKSLIVQNFNLPPGYNKDFAKVLLELPDNYPENPPGIGSSKVYVPSKLKFQGRKPKDFHKGCGPTKGFAWWCYEKIDWNPSKDTLITFFELLRAHMTNPIT